MNNNVIVEISVVPLGTGGTSLSRYIAECVSVLETSRCRYQLTPMGTIVEGPLDRVLELIKLMHEVPFKKGVSRVVTSIRIDDQRDGKASMKKKVESVLKVNPGIKAAKQE